jgi:hypothetical protein
MLACSTDGAEIENKLVAVHPFASEVIIVYDTAHNPVTDEAVIAPGFQEYVYAPVPPDADPTAVPSHPLEQLTLVVVTEAEIAVG